MATVQKDKLIIKQKLERNRKNEVRKLLTDDYISRHTTFSTLNELMAAIGIYGEMDFTAYPQDEFNEALEELTGYPSLEDMIAQAYFERETLEHTPLIDVKIDQ